MSGTALEEISVLTAIYCEKDEFELLQQSDTKGFIFRIQIALERCSEKLLLKLVFQLPPEYPFCLPDISISSEQLTRKQCINIKHSLLKRASMLISEPMVHELLVWLQQNFTAITTAEQSPDYSSPGRSCGERCEQETWTALLLIDHMRAKTKYTKMIEKWTSELELTGRLFLGKLILILLQGTKENIKKTIKVDVDSSGKKCKEKMMRVLWEAQLPAAHKQLPAFEVKDYSSLEELKKEFELAELLELYQEFVHTLV
nr:PREDICTED: RWD domain-containing protein 3 isoform X2 [Lepisosteus oculatus]